MEITVHAGLSKKKMKMEAEEEDRGGRKAGRGGGEAREKEEYIDLYNLGKTEVESRRLLERQGRNKYQATILNQFLSITMLFSSQPLWKNKARVRSPDFAFS